MELGRVNTLAEGVGIPLGAQGGKWLVGRPWRQGHQAGTNRPEKLSRGADRREAGMGLLQKIQHGHRYHFQPLLFYFEFARCLIHICWTDLAESRANTELWRTFCPLCLSFCTCRFNQPQTENMGRKIAFVLNVHRLYSCHYSLYHRV
jgi:hypothetical protein